MTIQELIDWAKTQNPQATLTIGEIDRDITGRPVDFETDMLQVHEPTAQNHNVKHGDILHIESASNGDAFLKVYTIEGSYEELQARKAEEARRFGKFAPKTTAPWDESLEAFKAHHLERHGEGAWLSPQGLMLAMGPVGFDHYAHFAAQGIPVTEAIFGDTVTLNGQTFILAPSGNFFARLVKA